MLRQIVLLGVERADALHLDDAAAGGHDSQLIHAHQFLAQLLIVQTVGTLGTTGIAFIHGVNGFFAQKPGHHL